MATIKSHTDLSQSKTLSKILPLESADMCFANDGTAIKIDANSYNVRKQMWKDCVVEIIPCWSLAALLSALPKNLNMGRPSLESNYRGYYWIQYYDEFMKPNNYKTECFNNPVDTCVEMIGLLHELKML